jgi:hypothetical protein
MDVAVDPFLNIMEIVCRNLFVAVDTYGRELRMAGDQHRLQIRFHLLSFYYIALMNY